MIYTLKTHGLWLAEYVFLPLLGTIGCTFGLICFLCGHPLINKNIGKQKTPIKWFFNIIIVKYRETVDIVSLPEYDIQQLQF